MVQLVARLRQILRLHGMDATPWEARLSAVDAAERVDPKRGREVFLETKLSILRARFEALASRLHRHPWLRGAPTLEAWMNERELTRGIVRLERDVREADRIANALEDVRAAGVDLRVRVLSLDLSAFESVTYEGLRDAGIRAEAIRRHAARESRNEARIREVAARAKRLTHATVSVQDLSTSAVTNPDDVARILAATETDLNDAEAADGRVAEVERILRDASVREQEKSERRALVADAARAARARDHVRLRALVAESERLRQRAAKAAEEGARLRRKGLARGPPRSDRDLQDMYG